MASAKISIIVPIYKVEKYLDYCINSIVNQTLKDIEIILVDDGSPDKCPQMCDEWARRDQRIKVIHKDNEGLGFARNSGLDIATGEYVTFIDSDDYIDCDAYERLCKLMDENDLDEIRFQCNRFKNDGSQSSNVYTDELKVVSNSAEIRTLALCVFDMHRKDLLDYQWGGSACMAVYRRSILEQNNLRFYSERVYLSEDIVFNFLFYLKSRKVGYLPCTFYHYRINLQSLTKTHNEFALDKADKYARDISKIIEEHGFKPYDTVFAMGYFADVVRVQFKNILLSNLPLKQKRAWFYKQTRREYFMKMSKTYPYGKLFIKQRLFFFFTANRCFFMTYLLVYASKLIGLNRFK